MSLCRPTEASPPHCVIPCGCQIRTRTCWITFGCAATESTRLSTICNISGDNCLYKKKTAAIHKPIEPGVEVLQDNLPRVTVPVKFVDGSPDSATEKKVSQRRSSLTGKRSSYVIFVRKL
jgi:hypothetical protein